MKTGRCRLSFIHSHKGCVAWEVGTPGPPAQTVTSESAERRAQTQTTTTRGSRYKLRSGTALSLTSDEPRGRKYHYLLYRLQTYGDVTFRLRVLCAQSSAHWHCRVPACALSVSATSCCGSAAPPEGLLYTIRVDDSTRAVWVTDTPVHTCMRHGGIALFSVSHRLTQFLHPAAAR